MLKLPHNCTQRWWHPTPVLLPGKSHGWRSLASCSPWGRKSDTTEWLHFHFHALEKEMATHSSVLAWRIPGTEEPGGLLSMGSHRVGHDWSDLAATAAAAHASKVMLKILQARLQQYVNHEVPDVQAGFRNGRGTRDQVCNICWIIKMPPHVHWNQAPPKGQQVPEQDIPRKFSSNIGT